MSISGVSGLQPTYINSTPAVGSGAQKALWAQVGHDLNSGNLSGAQAAFASLAKIHHLKHPGGPAVPDAGTHTPVTSTIGKSPPTVATPLRSDIEQLSQALKSGSLSDAQSAFAKLSQDYKAGGSANAGAGTSSGISVLA